MKKEFWLIVAIAILFSAIGIYFGLKKWDTAPVQADASQLLFNHSLPNINNEQQPLSKWQGKLLLVNFWATWCAPCVEEMPELSELQSEKAAQNVQIIGIGIDSLSNIQEFAAKYNISYPLYVSGMGGTELSKQFGNQQGGLPYTVLIGTDGKVKKTYLGRLNMQTVRDDLAAFY